MEVKSFLDVLGAEFYTGVPDSQLKPLCNYLMKTFGIDKRHHIIGVNEGNCVAIGAGYYLATGKTPVIYLQNSGEGNIINPIASLLNEKIYGIPAIFVIGWRGEPDIPDEPQHIFQGEITIKLLEDMGIYTFIVSKTTSVEELVTVMDKYNKLLQKGKQVAFIIRKGALEYSQKVKYENNNKMKREDIIEHILKYSVDDIIISTTGKASRELFEIRERNNQSHKYDFLTVGSMGYTSSIALGVAINKLQKRIWCIDGDGAALMHLGAMALIGANNPTNLIHIVINNSAHETVGGMPTIAEKIDICKIASSCGYKNTVCVDNFDSLDTELKKTVKRNELTLIEAKCSIASRSDLGRPTVTPIVNKNNFMKYLSE